MPNKPKNKHRMVRFSDEDWADLGELAGEAGTDRSAILRQFAHWWLRRPGAKLPERPPRRTRGDD
jgi:hypothetical protein